MIQIVPAKKLNDLEQISHLANVIWHEHYISMISVEQIEYMLIKYNSVQAIEAQINEGVLFFYITFDDIPVGYIAVKKELDYLFLSKLYVLNSHRGKKIGKAAMQHVYNIASTFEIKRVRLHVNKHNYNSILAYEKLGFAKVKSMITEIGHGYIMDDYQMEKVL